MATLKIKQEFKSKTVSFGSFSGAVSQATPAQLIDLAIMALESGDKTLTRLFVKLPDVADLKKEKMDISLGRAPQVEAAALIPPAPSEMPEFAGKRKRERGNKTQSNAPAAV